MKSSTTVQIFHSDSSLHKKQSSIQSTVPCYRIHINISFTHGPTPTLVD